MEIPTPIEKSLRTKYPAPPSNSSPLPTVWLELVAPVSPYNEKVEFVARVPDWAWPATLRWTYPLGSTVCAATLDPRRRTRPAASTMTLVVFMNTVLLFGVVTLERNVGLRR